MNELDFGGWQSWSYNTNSFFKLPQLNFNPRSNSKFVSKLKLNKLKKPAYGWCSWYAYGWDINEEKILKHANWIFENKTIPLEYILIDGGWNLWGDWLEEDYNKFPNGIKNTADKIKSLGLKPGIWIAPFLVHPKSNIATNHPEWLVKKDGKFVEGLRLTPFDKYLPYRKYILDIKNSKVLSYIDHSIKYLVNTCGFELIKLDFLYGIYFNPNITSTEADNFLNNFLDKIKKNYPHVYTIACGCPLLPAIGVVDSMRIGLDTSISPFLKFLSIPLLLRWYLNHRVIPTIVNRLWTQKFWNIDPNVFMCKKNLGLSPTLLIKFRSVIKLGKGNMFLGDDLTKLSNKRIKKIYLSLV